MQKSSLMFLLIIAVLAVIASAQAFATDNSGTAIIRFLGLSSFFMICISLMVGPLAVVWPKKFGILVEPRRSVGLTAFVFAILHYILVIVIYFNGDISKIPPLPQLQIAVPALLLLTILALTSSDYAMTRLGMWWKRIQRLNYFIFILAFVHFIMEVNFTHDGFNPNYSEIFAIFIGILTVILQIYGFYLRRKSTIKITE